MLTGASSYTGGTYVRAGTLQGDSGSLQGNILDNASVVFDQTTDGTYSGVLSGSGTLTKIGTGTLVLAETNTYSGGTILDEGTVSVSADANLGVASGSLTFDGGTLETTASFDSSRAVTLEAGGGTIDTEVGTLTLSGVVGGSGALTKTGDGTLVLTGTNTYSGGTNLDAGTVSVSRDENLGNAGGLLTFDGRHPGDHRQLRQQPGCDPGERRRDHRYGGQHPDLVRRREWERRPDEDRGRHPGARGDQHVFGRHDPG